MPSISALEIHVGSFTLEIQQSILVWLILCVVFATFFIVAGKKIERQDPSKASKGIVYISEEALNLVLFVIKGNLRETTKKYIPYIRKIVGKEHYEDVKNVMIMGGGRTAMHTALNVPGYMEVKIIESDPQRCDELNEVLGDKDVMVIHGDARDSSLLMTEGIQHTQAFVALTGQSESNILACLTAKRMGVRKTVALVDNLDYISMAEKLDIGTIINKKTIAASHIYQMMLDADVSNVKCLTVADADVAEFEVKPGARVTKKLVKDLGLPAGVAIGGLVRQGEGMHVNGMTQIQEGDSVVVFCQNLFIKKLDKFFV